MIDLTNLIFKQINFDDEIQTIKMAKKGNIIPTNVQNLQRFWHSINPISTRGGGQIMPLPQITQTQTGKMAPAKKGNIIPTNVQNLQKLHNDRFNEFNI